MKASIDSASAGRTEEIVHVYLHQFLTAAQSPHFEVLCDRTGAPLDYREYPGWTETMPGWYLYPFHGAFALFPVWAGVALCVIFVISWSVSGRKTPDRNLTSPIIALVYLSLTLCAMVGAPNDWGRILIPVSALLPIMAGATATCIAREIKRGACLLKNITVR